MFGQFVRVGKGSRARKRTFQGGDVEGRKSAEMQKTVTSYQYLSIDLKHT